MADMPKMQEHFSAVPQWRGILKQNAENAGAFFGGASMARYPQTECRKCRSNFRRVPRPYDIAKSKPLWLARRAGNAGAFSGGCLDRTTSLNRNHFGWPDMPKMQEHFSAGASTARHR